MPRLVHTADLHLGAPLGWLGSRAGKHREELKQTLTAVTDLAIRERADCLIIAGDLFDSQSPPASDVRHALKEFERLRAASGTPVVILPGCHDFLGPASVYASQRKDFGRHGRVTVLGLDGTPSADFPAAELTVRGTPLMSKRTSEHQLASVVPDPAYKYNVAVAHGALETAQSEADDHPIAGKGFAGWSYVALGHTHSWREASGERADAFYSGAPEVVGPDDVGAGHAAVVDLDERGATVRKERVGRKTIKRIELDLTGSSNLASIAERVRTEAPPDDDTILRLSLTGRLPVETDVESDRLCDLLRDDYFHVAVGSRSYELSLDETELATLPERLVVGRFARLMKEGCEAAESASDRQESQDALLLGVALLQGRDVLS
ncbi:MAG: hypothetical protein GF400_07740 [Candidatus Eisenbacteria bacterium]|nr:hypothetical protein [Candidatus Eisenbacteria bacterium]